MKVRQFQRLAEESTEDPQCLAEGLQLAAENVRDLLDQAEAARKEAPRLAEIARLHAGEEAGKGLILLDYLRPPAGVSKTDRARHLKLARDHLARGLYVSYYRIRPATFGEALEWIDRERRSHYLDGPEAVEWVFRNRIQDKRESVLYVDYVEQEGELRWRSPTEHAVRWELLEHWLHGPAACRVLLALERRGLLQPDALVLLADVWEGVELAEDSRWVECRELNQEWLTACADAGLIAQEDERDLGFLRDQLYWPLCGVDLSLQDVRQEVRARGERAAARYAGPMQTRGPGN